MSHITLTRLQKHRLISTRPAPESKPPPSRLLPTASLATEPGCWTNCALFCKRYGPSLHIQTKQSMYSSLSSRDAIDRKGLRNSEYLSDCCLEWKGKSGPHFAQSLNNFLSGHKVGPGRCCLSAHTLRPFSVFHLSRTATGAWPYWFLQRSNILPPIAIDKSADGAHI